MKTQTYHSWIHMRSRCNNLDHKNYADYGGRGITVCERWNSFANFLADMGERPTGMTLEREDVNKGYSPDNCRWATRRDQSRNRRDTVRLTKDNVTRTLAEWAELLGIKPITIHMRLRRGMTESEALSPASQSVKKNNRLITHDGKTLPLHEWARVLGIPRVQLTNRLFIGWTTERALTTPYTPRR